MGKMMEGEIKIEGLGSDEIRSLLVYTYEIIKKMAKDIAEERLRPEWAEKEATYIATYYKTLRQQGLNPHLAGKLTLLKQMNLKSFLKELPVFPREAEQPEIPELWKKTWKEKLNPENIGTTD
mgnify:CR=1 FL=1